jgi:hypothetical protein
MIAEASRGRDQDLRISRKRLIVVAHIHTADQNDRANPPRRAENLESRLGLLRDLARRSEHQAVSPLPANQPFDHRQDKARRLAGPRLRGRDQIDSIHRHGNRLPLNRGGLFVTRLFDELHRLRRKLEILPSCFGLTHDFLELPF